MFFSRMSSTRHGLSLGLRGRAKLMKSVMMPFRRVASSTMMSGSVLAGSIRTTFFLSSSAELRMMPSGLRISCEMPAAISPMEESFSARLSCSLSRMRSAARFSMIASPRLTTNTSTTNSTPISTVQVITTRIWMRKMVL